MQDIIVTYKENITIGKRKRATSPLERHTMETPISCNNVLRSHFELHGGHFLIRADYPRYIANFLSPDWMKLRILNCDWFAVVKGAMKNYNNYGV